MRDHVRLGVPRQAIPGLLVHDGMDEREANQLVDTRYDEIVREVEAQRVTGRSLLPVIAGALGAAIVGGIAWWLIFKFTEYELGVAAWAIGGLVGLVVLNLARGRRGIQLQVIAVLGAVLGMTIGKYLSYVQALKDAFTAEFGGAAADQVKTFSSETFRFFIEDLDLILSWYDLLWVGLAVYTAWRLPQGSERTLGRFEI